MRKAIIWAASVAFLFSVVSVSQAATRKTVTMPSASSNFKSGSGGTIGNGNVLLPGAGIEGEFIPSPTREVSVPLRTTMTVPTGRISGALKGALRVSPAGMVGTLTLQSILTGLDWVMEDGAISKKGDMVPVQGSFHWQSIYGTKFNSHDESCRDLAQKEGLRYSHSQLMPGREDAAYCYVIVGGEPTHSPYNSTYSSSRVGSVVCPTGAVYDTSSGRCLASSGTVPVSDSDFDLLDDFVQGQDGVWQRQAAVDSCEASPDSEGCYRSLPSSTTLSGPGTISVPGSVTGTSTKTNPDGSTSTTTTTDGSTISITYGDNYYDYTITTNTTTTSSDGTETKTDETMPFVPQPFAGVNEPLSGIPGEIAAQQSSGSSLGYNPWFDMGGGACTEWSFELPVVGTLTTNYCPIHEAYVRPFLYFIFALWTWHTCFAIWRETVTRVRAS